MSKEKVSFEVHPTSGPVQKGDIAIEGTGVSVKEFLKTAELSARNMNITVDDEPATLTTHVAKGSKVKLTEIVRGS
jgi:hypothetical protein